MHHEAVIDNSIIRSWCFAEKANQYSDNALESLKYLRATVPCIGLLKQAIY